MVIAFPFCDSVIEFPPANVRTPLETSASTPEVFPPNVRLKRSWVCTDCEVDAPEMVIVPPFASVDCERVMLCPPANTTLVPVTPVLPAVLPIFEIPPLKPAPAPPPDR